MDCYVGMLIDDASEPNSTLWMQEDDHLIMGNVEKNKDITCDGKRGYTIMKKKRLSCTHKAHNIHIKAQMCLASTFLY